MDVTSAGAECAFCIVRCTHQNLALEARWSPGACLGWDLSTHLLEGAALLGHLPWLSQSPAGVPPAEGGEKCRAHKALMRFQNS